MSVFKGVPESVKEELRKCIPVFPENGTAKEKFQWVLGFNARQTGDTTRLIKAAVEMDADVLVITQYHARRMKKRFPEAKKLNFYSVRQLDKLAKSNKPLLIDGSVYDYTLRMK